MERSEFINILRPYSPHEMTALLERNGFESVKIHEKWEAEGDVAQGEYIVLAQKSEPIVGATSGMDDIAR